jgi:hypothetical protein
MKKAGQILVEHENKQLDLEDDIIEYRKQMEPGVIEMIDSTIKRSKNLDIYKNKNFYIVYIPKVERVLGKPQNIVFARQSCPTPVYKQSVWKYNYISDSLEYLWSIPDALLYYHIVHNASKYLADKETADLAKFVLLMEAGEMLEWVKKENGEKPDAVIRITAES